MAASQHQDASKHQDFMASFIRYGGHSGTDRVVIGITTPSPPKTSTKKKKPAPLPRLAPDWMAPISPTGILCQHEGCTQWASQGRLETGPQWCYQHMQSDSMEMWTGNF